MEKSIHIHLASIKSHVKFNEIEDFDRFEERFFAIEQCYGDIVGMLQGEVEFCPNNDIPDLHTELLPWLWLIHPNLSNKIIEIADNELIELINSYNTDSKL